LKKILFILFFYTTLIQAQDLIINVNKNPVLVGEQILIQYTINGNSDNFQPPNFQGLRVISGPNTSTQSSYSFVNGKSKRERSTTYSFYVQAINEGDYNITSASVDVKGKKISSKPYIITAVRRNQKSEKEKTNLSDNLFLKAKVNKRNIVVGEQILVTYKLFTRIELHNTEISSLPNLNGFWKKELESSTRFKREIIDGIAYNVATIKKSVLTPQKSGELIVDPMELKCSVRIQKQAKNRDPFANFFGNSYNLQEKFISSKTIKINVAELPNPPAKFNGVVGEINVSSTIDKTNIHADEAITYKLKITGKGNLDLIKPININFPTDFEVYDPKITKKIFKGGMERSVKTFEYLIIPRTKGKYQIPSGSLIVYNPKTKKYETKESNTHPIKILESKTNDTEKKLNKQQKIIVDKKDIHYLFTKTNFNKNKKQLISPHIFYLLLFLPVILLFSLFTYNKLSTKTDNSSKTWKNKKANKIALKRLKNAQKCIKIGDFDGFFEEIEKSLWGYFADKFKVEAMNLSKETISYYFNSSSIQNNIKDKFVSLIDECEFARYSPHKNKNTQMDSLLEKAKSIIIEVETALK